jgi:glycosyltransferase involved in cell wall biosynthesis
MTNPEVSIVLLYNGENPQWLQRAAQALEAQTFKDIEIIIVNNDEKNYAAPQNISSLYWTKVFNNDSNLNVAQSYNLALDDAEGSYFIPHACDDWWLKDGVSRMHSYIEESYPNVWAVFSQSMNVDEKSNPIVATNPIDGLTSEQVTGQMEFRKELGNTVNSAAVIVRMSAIQRMKEKYGYVFDERLPHHEMWDLWLRMAQNRGRIVFREGPPVSNWYMNPVGRHTSPVETIYKNMIYSKIKSGFYD